MSQEIKYMYCKSHPLFALVPEKNIAEIASLAKVKTLYKGEAVSYGEKEFSKIHLLIKGKIKITEATDADSDLIKDILVSPDVFGDLGMEGKFSPDEYAEALTGNTMVVSFYVSDFKQVLQNNPGVAIAYANTVNNKLQRLEGRHSDLVFRDAKYRLIRFIKNWARTDGNQIGNKIVLNNYLTHSEIAGVIATSRQSVNVLLNELRDAGLLFYNRKSIELNDPLRWN